MARLCKLCRQDLDLRQRISGEDPLETRQGDLICPTCYQQLPDEKRFEIFP